MTNANAMILTPRRRTAVPTDGAGFRLTGGNLQFDLSGDFFGHLKC
jgi:hypothetical protein